MPVYLNMYDLTPINGMLTGLTLEFTIPGYMASGHSVFDIHCFGLV
jgi:hypothetical protein